MSIHWNYWIFITGAEVSMMSLVTHFMVCMVACLCESRMISANSPVMIDTVLSYARLTMNDSSLLDYLPFFKVSQMACEHYVKL